MDPRLWSVHVEADRKRGGKPREINVRPAAPAYGYQHRRHRRERARRRAATAARERDDAWAARRQHALAGRQLGETDGQMEFIMSQMNEQ
ncbi:unnamed protein product [Angiostrongylus costaricensis]|uniref:Uncharacterized protein n=1 Tax=Angiostrongylus costaricensis TaxID=334426 RepID=A0A0R3PIZ1_ANGCS|nr:unnamed protein product [Angiostrongylus costaricensis]